MSDLPKQLRIKAGMIHMGERITWGSDVAVMEQAADEIERLTAERDALRAANKDLQDWYDAAIADAKRYHHVKSKQGLIDSAVDKAMKGQP